MAQTRVIYEGPKLLWKCGTTLDVTIVYHVFLETIEAISYSATHDFESPRLYANRTDIYSKIDKEQINTKLEIERELCLRQHHAIDASEVRERLTNNAIAQYIFVRINAIFEADQTFHIYLQPLHDDIVIFKTGLIDVEISKPVELVEYTIKRYGHVDFAHFEEALHEFEASSVQINASIEKATKAVEILETNIELEQHLRENDQLLLLSHTDSGQDTPTLTTEDHTVNPSAALYNTHQTHYFSSASRKMHGIADTTSGDQLPGTEINSGKHHRSGSGGALKGAHQHHHDQTDHKVYGEGPYEQTSEHRGRLVSQGVADADSKTHQHSSTHIADDTHHADKKHEHGHGHAHGHAVEKHPPHQHSLERRNSSAKSISLEKHTTDWRKNSSSRPASAHHSPRDSGSHDLTPSASTAALKTADDLVATDAVQTASPAVLSRKGSSGGLLTPLVLSRPHSASLSRNPHGKLRHIDMLNVVNAHLNGESIGSARQRMDDSDNHSTHSGSMHGGNRQSKQRGPHNYNRSDQDGDDRSIGSAMSDNMSAYSNNHNASGSHHDRRHTGAMQKTRISSGNRRRAHSANSLHKRKSFSSSTNNTHNNNISNEQKSTTESIVDQENEDIYSDSLPNTGRPHVRSLVGTIDEANVENETGTSFLAISFVSKLRMLQKKSSSRNLINTENTALDNFLLNLATTPTRAKSVDFNSPSHSNHSSPINRKRASMEATSLSTAIDITEGDRAMSLRRSISAAAPGGGSPQRRTTGTNSFLTAATASGPMRGGFLQQSMSSTMLGAESGARKLSPKKSFMLPPVAPQRVLPSAIDHRNFNTQTHKPPDSSKSLLKYITSLHGKAPADHYIQQRPQTCKVRPVIVPEYSIQRVIQAQRESLMSHIVYTTQVLSVDDGCDESVSVVIPPVPLTYHSNRSAIETAHRAGVVARLAY